MCQCVNVSRNAFLSSFSERKHFLWRWYCHENHKNVKIEIWFILVCTLIDYEYASLLFSQTFFPYCFCMLSDFAKVFERKFWLLTFMYTTRVSRVQIIFSYRNLDYIWNLSLSQDLLTIENTTRTWKCTRCIMQMSYLYASGFPFKNFCKITQHTETIRKKCLGKE